MAKLDVERVRQDFPILENGMAYLDSANTSLRPRQVVAAMTDYFEHYNANIHRSIYQIGEMATEHYEGAREKVRAFVGAPSAKEVIFTRGTTEAINLVAYTWGRQNIKAGDVILLSLLEHHSNIVPWQRLASEVGASVLYVDIDEQGDLRQDQFAALLKRSPKLVALGQVSNALGTINPIHAMVKAAKAAGAVVLVDGAQGAPHTKVDVAELGADFYAFSGHKMLGPTGVGVLWGRRELLEAMPPFLAGGDMIRQVTTMATTYNDLPWKFEAGTQAIAEVIGLGAAIDYLEHLGMETISAHEHAITSLADEALREIKGLRIWGPPPARRGGIVSFTVEGVHPHDLATIADRSGVCVRAGHHCAMPLMTRLGLSATTRASFYAYSRPDDVDRLAAAVKEAQRILA
jgi:cysteine desulfurase/selenocysteine lyase